MTNKIAWGFVFNIKETKYKIVGAGRSYCYEIQDKETKTLYHYTTRNLFKAFRKHGIKINPTINLEFTINNTNFIVTNKTMKDIWLVELLYNPIKKETYFKDELNVILEKYAEENKHL